MFLGTFQLKLDDKGRLNIPSRYREILQEEYPPAGHGPISPELILSFVGRCITAYPKAEWMRLAHTLTAAITLPSLHRDFRDLERVLFSNAAECSIDAQGRVLIPPLLREKANLEGDVIIAGVNTYFEIWNREHWDDYSLTLEGREEEIAQKFAELSDARLPRREHTFGDGLPPRL